MRKIHMAEKTVTRVSGVIKYMAELNICVDIRQVHTTGLLRCNAQNARKRLREQTI